MMATAGFTPGFCERNRVETEVPLARWTTLRIGGAATIVTLEDVNDLPELLDRPVRWLGKGANLLVGDGGVGQPVIRLGKTFGQLDVGSNGDKARLTVGGSVDLGRMVRTCAEAGLAGPEGLAGVPASVGGALCMNAGTAHAWLFDFVSRVRVVLPGETEPQWLNRSEVPAEYRTSGLPKGTLFLACELELSGGHSDTLRARAMELKQHKAATQPLAARSAGCTFQNPSSDMPAGRLIDELGLKGETVGAASVSTRHANFIVNQGEASAAEVATLVNRIRQRAWQERGVRLQMEVKTWSAPASLRATVEDLEPGDV